MLICPNKKDKVVAQQFNELLEAVNGNEGTAYRVWSLNGGNAIDKAPNGAESKLFLTLLDYTGDRTKAIKLKCLVYSKLFIDWFGDWTGRAYDMTPEELELIDLIYHRFPQLALIGTKELYNQYIQSIFPKSKDKSVYWHGSNSDFSEGFESATREEGSGAPETKERNDFYLAKQAWTVLQYVNGVNRKSVDKNGFAHWNKLWWEFKEIMSNGRRENNDWKDIVINEQNVRLAIPNKRGIFNRDKGGGNGKWLSERKADYGYENKSDKEFFEEILGVKWGEDTFNTWTKRNAEIFKSLQKDTKGIYPVVINTQNPITESGLNTYYEELRGLMTKANEEGNDAILSEKADNEFGSDVAVALNIGDTDEQRNSKIHFLGTKSDIESFKQFVESKEWTVSKVVDENGEPLVVWIGTFGIGRKNSNPFKRSQNAILASINEKDALKYGFTNPVYINIKYDYSNYVNQDNLSNFIKQYDNFYLEESEGPYEDVNKHKLAGVNLPDNIGIINTKQYKSGTPSDYIVSKANQIKHIENIGTFDPKSNNIYQASIDLSRQLGFERLLSSVNNSSFFGESYSELLNGNQASSASIMSNLISTKSINKVNQTLADVLSKHDVPVIFGTNEFGKPAETIERDGGFVIVIDPELFLMLRTAEASDIFMHEIVHALTVKALKTPITIEDIELATATNKLYSLFESEMKGSQLNRFTSATGAYILKDKFEFVAEFVTNENSRQVLYEKAVEIDKKTNGRVRLRLKRFINAVTNFFCNKRIFKLKQDEFNTYWKKLNSYLFYKPAIKHGNISNAELLDAIYHTYDFLAADKQRDMNRRTNMIRYFEDVTRYAAEVDSQQELQESEQKKDAMNLDDLRSKIASWLEVRLLSITTSSTFNEEQKSKYSNIVKQHINMFVNKNVKSIVILSLFAEDVAKLLLYDLDEVRMLTSTSDSYYMTMYHDNFATYHNIFEEILRTLNNPDYSQILQDEMNNVSAFDKFGAIKSFDELKTIVAKVYSVSEDGIGHMLYILTNNLKQRAKDITLETGSDEYQNWIDEFNTISYDTNSLLSKWGAKDGSSDPTVRAILHLINKADRLKRDASYRRLTELVKLHDALKFGESMSDIYETANGYKTGNVVRRINYGKYKQEEAEMYALINELYGLSKTNRRIPDDDTLVEYKSLFIKDSKHNYKEGDEKSGKKIPIRRAWNLQKNEWLSIHAERKYKPEYYEAYAGLSEKTLSAINAIRDQINQIKNRCERDEAGHYLYDSLSDEDWKTLNGLYIQRRALSSPLNLDGTLKKEGTDPYDIYKELSELNETLYNKDKDYHDREAWWNARTEVRNKLVAENTDLQTGEIDFDAVEKGLKKWDDRNSRRKLKKEGDDILVYKQIDDEVYEITKEEKPIFEINGDGGAAYDAADLRIRDILNLFRNHKGEVSLDFLPQRAKKIIKDLENEKRDIRKQAIKEDKTKKLRKQWITYRKTYGKIRKKYLVTRKTDEYLAKHADDALITAFELMQRTSDLPRWCTKVVVRDDVEDEDLIEEYTELVPGDGWITLEDRNELLNPEFERLQKLEGNEDETTIPKQELYDNSEAFDKINNSKTLRAFYNEVVGVIKDSNDLFYNNAKASRYRLPQISGSMWNYIQSLNKGAWDYIKLQIGYKDKEQVGMKLNDEFGMNVDSILDSFLDFAETVEQNKTILVSSLRGQRADERLFNVIPPRYTTPLDDPSLISSDLIGILYEYFDSAMNVKYKNEYKDTIEAFIDMLEYRTYEKKEKNQSGELSTRQIKGKDTNTYKSARKAVDMFLYSIKQEPIQAGNWNISKGAQLLKMATTAINLGASPVVALTGFFTSSYAHMINALVGDKAYGGIEAAKAAWIVLCQGFKSGFGLGTIGKQNTKNKLMGIAEMFNLIDQGKKKFEKSHQNRILRSISNNYIFGLLTGTDYIIKSNIMVSILLSHHFVDDKFIAKEDIRNNYRSDSQEYIDKIKQWNEGVSVWDVLEMKDGVIEIKEQYKKAFEDCYDILYNRIIKTAEQADGVATETQKAEITSNIIGAAVLIHRQYLPLQLQDRWGRTVWDMDQQLMKQASFRSAWEFLMILIFKSIYSAYKSEGNFFSNYTKSVKGKYNSYFNDESSDYTHKLSRARRKHLKKVGLEFVVYYATFKLLLSLLFAAADDKDNKDKLLLQLAAYVARRTQWEAFNAYRPTDLLSSILTVTAETSLTDKLQYIWDTWSSRNALLGIVLDDLDLDTIKRGVYKGWQKRWRALWNLFPYHNAYEQYFGSRDKRRYYENKIMREN